MSAALVVLGVWEWIGKSPAKTRSFPMTSREPRFTDAVLNGAQPSTEPDDSRAVPFPDDADIDTRLPPSDSNQPVGNSISERLPETNQDGEPPRKNDTQRRSNAGMAASQSSKQDVAAGKRLFEHRWQPNDPLAGNGDGLGPVFNGRSCVECHFQGGVGGSGTNAHNVESFEVLGSAPGIRSRDGIIHAAAIEPSLQESKGNLVKLLGSPMVPFLRLKSNQPRTNFEASAIRSLFMNTPALWGDGLIDQITDDDLRQSKPSQPLSGRLRPAANGHYGKFGWKAQISSLSQFVGSACAAELGLSNSIRSQQKPLAYQDDSQARSDLTEDQLAALTLYVSRLPAPRQILPRDSAERQQVENGMRHFHAVGCANCHVPDVGPAAGVYSDFRLHLIDSATTRVQTYYEFDAIPVYAPAEDDPQLGEWKTPPLWGLADSAPYWHDGTAPTIRQAIQMHANTGAASREAFLKLNLNQQEELLAFLGTLRAPAESH